MRKGWLTVMLALLLVVLVTSVVSADKYKPGQWKKLKKNVNTALQGADRETVIELIQKVAKDNSKRAVEFLIAKGLQVTDPEVYHEIKRAIASITDKKALREMAKLVRKYRDERIRIMLVEVLGQKGDKEFIDDIGAILASKKRKKEDMSLIRTAIEALANIGGKRSLRHLANYLARIEEERKGSRLMGTDWLDCRMALKRITRGEVDYEEAEDWRNYVETLPDDWDPVKKDPKTGEDLDFKKGDFTTVVMSNKVPKFFGMEVTSLTPVFVIDVSGSMTEKDKPDLSAEREKKDKKTATGTTPVDQLKKPQQQPGGKPAQPAALGDDRMRIVRAQKELIKLIRALDAGVRFNIVAYERMVHTWSKSGLKAATPGNKVSAIKFVNAFQAVATTHTDDAMEKAWENIKDGCDTIYLLSDGSPTHKGDCSDSNMLIEEILDFFRTNNKFKKIKIFTLGFKDANVPFMTRLAKENNGKYRDIK